MKQNLPCPICKTTVSIIKTIHSDNRNDNLLSCGHKFIEISLQDTFKAYDLLGTKKKGPDDFSKNHKWEHEQIIGERVGRDGKAAFIYQIIDRPKDYYKKFVRQGNKVIKDIEGKLSDHKK